MSKITTAKKEAKLKGKQAKIAAANAKKAVAVPKAAAEVKAPGKIKNYGCCCTCQFYGKPCRKTNEYTARKAEKPCYKQRG